MKLPLPAWRGGSGRGRLSLDSPSDGVREASIADISAMSRGLSQLMLSSVESCNLSFLTRCIASLLRLHWIFPVNYVNGFP